MDDWALLALAKTDARAFAQLFERHRDYVFRLAWGFAGGSFAEDIAQDVFVRVLEHRKRWVRRAKFTTLLYQITLNASREHSRKASRELSIDDQGAVALGLEQATVVEGWSKQPGLDDLSRGLSTLSARQREVVVLRHLEGLSTKETARVLRCAEGSVKVHLHRGMAALRQFF